MYGAGGQKRVPSEFNKDFRVPLPLLDEQRAIADFLDRETARLETLVGKKRELIEKLKEKRTALISRTVTRGLPAEAAAKAGLNPHPKLKPSGIEWLGDVPEHWDVKQGRYVGRIKTTVSLAEDEIIDAEGVIPYIKVEDLNSDHNIPVFSEAKFRSVDTSHSWIEDALIFPKRGAAIFTNKVSILRTRALLDPNLMGWQMLGQSFPKYYYYILKGRGLDDLADTSTVPQINNKHIYSERFPAPPLSEQRTIADYLDRETAKLDRLMEKVAAAIEKLQEYRTALITAAVTGKIDVRGLADSAVSTPVAGSSTVAV